MKPGRRQRVLSGLLMVVLGCGTPEPSPRLAALLADPMANIEELPGVEFERRDQGDDGTALEKPVAATVGTSFVAVDEKSARLAADAAKTLAEEAGWVSPFEQVFGYTLEKQIGSEDITLYIGVDHGRCQPF